MQVGKGHVPMRNAIAALLPAALLAAGGCTRDAAPDDATLGRDVRAALQGHFDTHPQCAPVLQTDGATDDLVARPDDPAAAALTTAGLIERAAPGIATVGGERVVRYRPAAAHRASFAKGRWGTSEGWLLCFARRSIESVDLRRGSDGVTATATYRFRLVDPAPWLRQPAIATGFPKVVATLSGSFDGEEPVPLADGKPRLDVLQPTSEHSLVTDGAAFLTR